MITAKGDCLLTTVQIKDVNELENILSKPIERDGMLVWTPPAGLRTLRKQVQFNAIKDPTGWMYAGVTRS